MTPQVEWHRRKKDCEQLVRRVQDRMGRSSRGPGWPELSSVFSQADLRAAAEAAVEELKPDLGL